MQTSVRSGDASVKGEIAGLRDSLAQMFDQSTMKAVEQQLIIYEKIRQENARADSLQRAQQLMRLEQGRLETMGLLTSSIDHFISRAKDLRDAFEFNGHKAFTNTLAVDELNARIAAYNEAYEDLDRNRNRIIDMTESYWPESYEARARARDLLEFALDDVHKMTNLSSNNLIRDLADYRDPRVKRRDKRAKREIQSDIDRFCYDLRNKIGTLELRKSEVFQVLDQD